MTSNTVLDHDSNCGVMKLSTKTFKETNMKLAHSSIKILNIPWRFVVTEADGMLKFKLFCNESCANTMWSCHADIDILIDPANLKSGNTEKCKNMNFRTVFDYKNKVMDGYLSDESSKEKNGSSDEEDVDIEVRLKMTRIYGYRKRKIINYSIEHPRFSNGIILIEDRKIHVNKQILAMHSKFFSKLFFGDFREKDRKIIDITKYASHDEFLIFLDFVHPTGRKIEEGIVENLIKLADVFLADRIMDSCEEFLIKTDSMDVVRKLIWAEKYSLSTLMDHCLNGFKRMDDFIQLKKSENYQEISDEVKSTLLERAFQLHKQRHPGNY